MTVTSGKEIQTENGFVQIHPAILDLLAEADLNASEFKCVLFLLRKTYGWGKKEDTLSYGQIAEATSLSRRGVINSMQSLIDKRVVFARDTKIGRNGCRTYGFNKYFEQWLDVLNGEQSFTIPDDENGEPPCTISPANGEQSFTIKPEMVNNPSLEMVNNPAPTIDKKENNSSSAAAAVFACWKDNMPGTMSTILADDLGDLVDTYGSDTVVRAITEAVRSNGRSVRYVAKILENWATGKSRPPEKVLPVAVTPSTANGKVSGFSLSEMLGGS
jgi:phage replication O-like protein O